MNVNRDFKGVWIPRVVWLDKNLSWVEKLLLVEIDSLDNKDGCWASNKYFADFFDLSKDRVSKLISSLSKKEYISVNLIYKDGTKQVEKRVITITDTYRRKQLEGIVENNDTPIVKNNEENNTSFNNTINNKTICSSKAEQIPYKEIVEYLNSKTNKRFNYKSNKTRDLIKARYNEGYLVNDFKKVIDYKTNEWLNNNTMNKYLRPATLFSNKFDNYINEVPKERKEKSSAKKEKKESLLDELF